MKRPHDDEEEEDGRGKRVRFDYYGEEGEEGEEQMVQCSSETHESRTEASAAQSIPEEEQRIEAEIRQDEEKIEAETQRIEAEIRQDEEKIEAEAQRIEAEMQSIDADIRQDKERIEADIRQDKERIEAEAQSIEAAAQRIEAEAQRIEAEAQSIEAEAPDARERRQALEKRREALEKRREALEKRREAFATDARERRQALEKRRETFAAYARERRQALEKRRETFAADVRERRQALEKRRETFAAYARERWQALEKSRREGYYFENAREKSMTKSESTSLTTKANQAGASSFISNPPEGFGFLPLCSGCYSEELVEMGIGRLIPTNNDIVSAPDISELCGEKLPLGVWKETVDCGVQAQMNKLAESKRFKGLLPGPMSILNERHLSDGIASPQSKEDNTICINDVYLACIENKGDGDLVAGVLQCATEATNYAMHLLARGVPRCECVVPVIAHCATLMHFGATVILEDSFPTYVPLSKQLDMLDHYERNVASAFLAKACAHCANLRQTVQSVDNEKRVSTRKPFPKRQRNEMKLSLEGRYHIKRMTQQVREGGLGMFNIFGGEEEKGLVNRGVAHMMRALNMLYASDARDVAEYPLSIRTPDSEDNCYSFVYRDLTRLGYKTGTPNRLEDSELYDKFIEALETAVKAVHNAGVIHVDLYASNVMWKTNGSGEVNIKIIDWDAAHVLREGDFHKEVKNRLYDRLDGRVQFGPAHDLLYLSAFKIDKNKVEDCVWVGLASNEKKQIDNAFNALLDDKLMEVSQHATI